jgi:hypothetical protein
MRSRFLWAAALLLLPGVAQAFPYSVTRTTGPSSGSPALASNDQVYWNPGNGNWSGGNFSITSSVAKTGVNVNVGGTYYQEFLYTYTMNTPTNGDSRLSHVIVELSSNILTVEKGIYGVTLNNLAYDTGTLNGAIQTHLTSQGNDGMPGSLFGIKLNRTTADVQTTTFSFKSLQVPVWGDFYAKDGAQPQSGGTQIYAYNKGFGTNPGGGSALVEVNGTGDEFKPWIITADTGRLVAVPEPSALAIAGLGALGFLGYGLRRRNRA